MRHGEWRARRSPAGDQAATHVEVGAQLQARVRQHVGVAGERRAGGAQQVPVHDNGGARHTVVSTACVGLSHRAWRRSTTETSTATGVWRGDAQRAAGAGARYGGGGAG